MAPGEIKLGYLRLQPFEKAPNKVTLRRLSPVTATLPSSGVGALNRLYFNEKSGLLLPFVASIVRSGMFSRISSLMSCSLGFFGRCML